MRALALLAVAAVAGLPPGLRGQDVGLLPTRAKIVALTFDGGADAGHAQSILKTLRRERTPATFFLTGGFVRSYPQLARAIAGAYPIGNHSDTHPLMTHLTDAEVHNQIMRAESSIRAVAGVPAVRLFRFPYGDRDARTIGIANALGYVCVRWTIDTLGWMAAARASIVQRVLDGMRPGAIILMHIATLSTDAGALPAVIAAIRSRGYRFATLAALEPKP